MDSLQLDLGFAIGEGHLDPVETRRLRMFRSSVQTLGLAAMIAILSLGSATMASAASANRIDRQAEARAGAPLVQDVHWVWHHHHRYWVRDYYRHY